LQIKKVRECGTLGSISRKKPPIPIKMGPNQTQAIRKPVIRFCRNNRPSPIKANRKNRIPADSKGLIHSTRSSEKNNGKDVFAAFEVASASIAGLINT
jgi:hypothetical protein